MLKDVFGTENVHIDTRRVVVNERVYPVLDGVIILLDPSQYPAGLKKKLGVSEAKAASRYSDFAEDVQFTFGEEWRKFPQILPEHEREFFEYFDLINLNSLKEARVCDLGCGIGRWSYFLHRRCRQLVLVDFSEAIFIARRNLGEASNTLFFMADLKRLPFRESFADLIICLGVLHHLPTPALDEVRQLKKYAPRLLIYVYYALDNRPFYFRALLAGVNKVRLELASRRSRRLRHALTWFVSMAIYLPLVLLGTVLRPFSLSQYIPLYEGYHRKSLKAIRQDVYDRFFTKIEQRHSREQILGLIDTFSKVVVSDKLPYWHFICERREPGDPGGSVP